MNFEFATAGRVLFGAGSLRSAVIGASGGRALVVTGRSPVRAGALIADLEALRVVVATFATPGEPTLGLVRRGVTAAREHGADVVVGIGGGSAIDAAKAIAALAPNSGEPLDYLEVIGLGHRLERPPLPLVAIPTTAGTGAEVTRTAVLGSQEHGVKASLRDAAMLPRAAIVDPGLTLDLPPAITAATGLDALTQLIEPYTSRRANPMTGLFCREGIAQAALALPRAFADGEDRDARSAMSWASLLGGLALANAGLGAVHGFAAPIGGRFEAPHGAICAALLPHVMEANLAALRARAPASPVLERYREVAAMLTGRPGAHAEDGIEHVRHLCRGLAIPGLSAYGIDASAIPELTAKAARASSMKANPIELTAEELAAILERAL